MVDAPNPRSFKAAREQRKLDLHEVAQYTGISASRLEDFESGTRKPSLKQVDALSQLYNVPIYLLYLDVTPNLEMVLPDFRRVTPGPADLSPRGLARLWSTERVAEFAKQLLTEVSSQLPAFKALTKRTKLGKSYASDLRSEFDDWFGAKRSVLGLSGTPEAQCLAGMRLFYESHLNISLVNEAPPSDYFGFYNEPTAGIPAIFVNRKISSKKAQLFTFMHEFGHSVLGQEGISDPFAPNNGVERACNRFAAEFLAPEKQFASLVESYGRTDSKDPTRLVQTVSRRCLLSQQATAVRLRELEYISSKQFVEWRRKWTFHPSQEKEQEREESGGGGPGAFAKQVGELGYLTVYLASTAYESKIVDSLDIQRGLGLSESVQSQAFALAKKRLEAVLD